MPDKQQLTIAYAAGASLAAATLIYVFAPTFFIDGESSTTSTSSRKKTIVGLLNPANDCFINSTLQALAGLGDLRIYLIRESHRRRLDGPGVYVNPVADPMRKNLPAWKLEGLQNGIASQGLKDILDALNERPIYKKTISAVPFVTVLESAFKQRITRTQQDAHEFLQIVVERLCDEYHAGHRARNHARAVLNDMSSSNEIEQTGLKTTSLKNGGAVKPSIVIPGSREGNGNVLDSSREEEAEREKKAILELEEGFPMEGGSESQIECLTCGFKPKPTTTTFCVLTLSVPRVASTTLSTCFDDMFKTEHIDDFRCDKCRLVHALAANRHELAKSNSASFKEKTQATIEKLEHLINANPEADLTGIELPDSRFAPKRTIAKHVRITKFPKLVAIHLSRSIYDGSSIKNQAKIAFPEHLPLGGLANRRSYKLSSVVCHKGSHSSGHYEVFRRQSVNAPFATPNTFQVAHVYSKTGTPIPSQISTPLSEPVPNASDINEETSTLSSTPELLSPTSAASSSPSLPYTTSSSGDSVRDARSFSTSTNSTDATTKGKGPTSAPRDKDSSDGNSIRSVARSARDSLTTKLPKSMTRKGSKDSGKPENAAVTTNTTLGSSEVKRKPNKHERWWRISDEKVKESKTREVLSMQREVYLLFYEIEKNE